MKTSWKPCRAGWKKNKSRWHECSFWVTENREYPLGKPPLFSKTFKQCTREHCDHKSSVRGERPCGLGTFLLLFLGQGSSSQERLSESIPATGIFMWLSGCSNSQSPRLTSTPFSSLCKSSSALTFLIQLPSKDFIHSTTTLETQASFRTLLGPTNLPRNPTNSSSKTSL